MKRATTALAIAALALTAQSARSEPLPPTPAPAAPGPASLAYYAPSVLPYVPGMPVFTGYHVEHRRNRSLLIAGAAVFASGYLTSVFVATAVLLGQDRHRFEVAPLYAPFAGPFATLGTSRNVQLNDPYERTNGIVLIASGVVQLTGAALFIAGLATHETRQVRDVSEKERWSGARSRSRRAAVDLTPVVSPFGVGLSGAF